MAVNGQAFASDDGFLLPGKKFGDVVTAIKASSTYTIPTMDVVRRYATTRSNNAAEQPEEAVAASVESPASNIER